MVNKEIINEVIQSVIEGSILETVKCRPGYKSPSVRASEFNQKNFKGEEYEDNQNAHPHYDDMDYYWDSPQGRLQKIQSDLQSKMNNFTYENPEWSGVDANPEVAKDNYTYEEIDIINQWATYSYDSINGYLYSDYPSGDSEIDTDIEVYTVKDAVDILSRAINKSPRLQENAVTYRYGRVNELEQMEVGDWGKFDGFVSTSFNYTVATHAFKEQVQKYSDTSNRGVIRLFNPQGTKGVVVDDTVYSHDYQSEWLLDKGQKYVLVNKGMVDYDGEEVMTYDILLYD